MCPHGAGKSVLASAYFEKLAREKGLNVRVDARGTEPDPRVSPKVAEHLTKNGYRVPVETPQKVTPDELASADIVISLGCDVKGLARPAPARCGSGTRCPVRARISPAPMRRSSGASPHSSTNCSVRRSEPRWPRDAHR